MVYTPTAHTITGRLKEYLNLKLLLIMGFALSSQYFWQFKMLKKNRGSGDA